jgi:hypothetical protein
MTGQQRGRSSSTGHQQDNHLVGGIFNEGKQLFYRILIGL